MWSEIIRYAEATSTNDLARDHARLGAPEGTVVVAAWQAAGRGRKHRGWTAPPGKALLCSVILRPPPSVARSAWLTLAAGVATAEAVRGLTELEARLKWPNDVRCGGRKLAGILTETWREERETVAVVGIGLNLNQETEDFAGELSTAASSLKLLTGREWAAQDLLDVIRAGFQSLYERLCSDDTDTLRRRWSELDETIGRAVVVETGDSEYRGKATSVDEYGALWVEDADGEPQRIVVGDVSLRFDD